MTLFSTSEQPKHIDEAKFREKTKSLWRAVVQSVPQNMLLEIYKGHRNARTTVSVKYMLYKLPKNTTEKKNLFPPRLLVQDYFLGPKTLGSSPSDNNLLNGNMNNFVIANVNDVYF